MSNLFLDANINTSINPPFPRPQMLTPTYRETNLCLIYFLMLILILKVQAEMYMEHMSQGYIKVGGSSHCEPIFAEAIPNSGENIASTGKERRFRNDTAIKTRL